MVQRVICFSYESELYFIAKLTAALYRSANTALVWFELKLLAVDIYFRLSR